MNAERLKSLIEAGDRGGIVDFFTKASEAERKTVANVAVERLKHEAKTPVLQPTPGTYTYNPCMRAAELAVLASCSFSQLKQLGAKARHGGEDLCQILLVRRPEWLDQWLEIVIESEPNFWATVRRLVREVGCCPPRHDNYILGMIYGVNDRSFPLRKNRTTLRDALLEDSELLEREVWRLFEVEGSGEHSLAAHDKYARVELSWDQTLVGFAREGRLSRERLLDASLDALARGYAQFRAGWFARFHDMMEPTIEEQHVRTNRYVELLASAIPTTVSWALKRVETIDKQQPFQGTTLVEFLRTATEARSKGTVTAALKFLARIAKRDRHSQPAACLAATAALGHESSEVQTAATDLLEKFGDLTDEQLLQSILRYAAVASASIRPRLDKLLASAANSLSENRRGLAHFAMPCGQNVPVPLSADGSRIGCKNAPLRDPAATEVARPASDLGNRLARLPTELSELAGVQAAQTALEHHRLDVTALDFDGTEFPRLDPAARLTPVQTLDGLVDLAAQVIEGSGSADDVERVLDAVSRLCDQRPDEFVTGPLAKRVADLSGKSRSPFLGFGPIEDLLGVLRAWLTRTARHPVGQDEEGRSKLRQRWDAMDSLSHRAMEIAVRVASDKPSQLLSAPTHMGGWIDPPVLVERVNSQSHSGAKASALDEVFALLRLAPDHRPEARAMAAAIPGEFGAALRYAMGEEDIPIGPTASLWIAAARARSCWMDDDRVEKAHPGFGPDAGRAAKYELRTAQRGDWPYLRIERQPMGFAPRECCLVTARLHYGYDRRAHDPSYSKSAISAIRWQQSIWPMARESLFAEGVEAIGSNLDWWEAHWEHRCYLEPLLDSDVPLRPMALLLLTLALAAKEPGEQGLATEVLIAAIRDGRIDGEKLGATMANLWPLGVIKMSRWKKALADAGRISPLHGQVVFESIERALQGEVEKLPRDAHAILDLFKELGIQTGSSVQAEPTRQLLSAIKPSGKTGKAAATLLALVETPDLERRSAVMQTLLLERLLRAERWAARRVTGHNG